MSKSWLIRLAYWLGLLSGLFYLPFWLWLVLLGVALIHQPHFYEALLPALLFDLIYGAPGVTLFGFRLLVTTLTLAAVYLVGELKQRTRWSWR